MRFIKPCVMLFALTVSAQELRVNTNTSVTFTMARIQRDTNHIELRVKNHVRSREMDYTATNIVIESTHEPVLLGKSNGVWVIHFR